MKNVSKTIEPVPFRSGRLHPQPKLSAQLRWLLGVLLGVLFICLAYTAWFVFTAKQVVLQIIPEPERISIEGGLVKLRLGEYYLLRPGPYVLKAFRKGYHQIALPFTVSNAKSQKVSLAMEKLPGRLTVSVHQTDRPAAVIEGAKVYLDGKELGLTPLTEAAVQPGRRQLLITAKDYQDLNAELNITGMDIPQSFTFALVPGWADITIRSVPSGADVFIDAVPKGKTPLQLKLRAGTFALTISAERYKTWQRQLDVEPNQPQVLDLIELQPADGVLVLRTKPPGANVTIGGSYVGQTPIEIALGPDTEHRMQIVKAGYETIERTVRVATADFQELDLTLVPRKGIIHFTTQPADARLSINGKLWGTVPKTLSLVAVTHKLEISKEGYEPYRTTITPRPGFPQELKVSLKKKLAASAAAPGVIKASNGYELKLMQPAAFTLGSSRREQGRRSNETLREVVLKRPFYIGLKEVTNQEFRQFLAGHNSGFFKSYSLNRAEQPVVQVSWEQAALFCNWLSAKEKLPPVYVKQGDTLIPQETLPAGYRLPTEAEWEYCARFVKDRVFWRYPWGDTFPPQSGIINIADVSAKDLLAGYLESYNDGYPVTASPGSFQANALGLFDLGGNVAEWCHDYYSIDTSAAQVNKLDPAGPKQGKHHVVRGSSWKHASISALRAAFRDYSNDKRNDLGFRICRYVQ